MSERWWRRRRRSDFGFRDFLEEADKMEKTMDEMIRRAFGSPDEKEKARRNYPHQLRNPHSSQDIDSLVKGEYEPLVDTFEDAFNVVVVAELFGVDKDYIEVNATGDKVTIWVNSPRSQLYKELSLPAKVDPKSLATSYRNGVLEVRLKKQVDGRLLVS